MFLKFLTKGGFKMKKGIENPNGNIPATEYLVDPNARVSRMNSRKPIMYQYGQGKKGVKDEYGLAYKHIQRLLGNPPVTEKNAPKDKTR
jgi:hypothetical protein